MIPNNGYVKGELKIDDSLNRLESYIKSFPEQMKKQEPGGLLQRPNPGKWSKQEILGHLIDSALNNLKRFTDIQYRDQPYAVDSYGQNELVTINNYQQLPLDHLLNLWQALNRQIIFAVNNIPAEKLGFAVDPNYDNREMKTLAWLICDYVAHMEHHFKQMFP